MATRVHAQERAGQPRGDGQGRDRSRLLAVLAVERALRALALIGIGIIVVTHVHADWVDLVRRVAGEAGLDPSGNVTGRLISSLIGLGPAKAERGGAIAIGYGLLEAAEAYGLLRRRLWGEYLTVISTALLFIPEIQELIHKPTGLKIAALVLNIIIVVYLVVRLVRRRHDNRHPQSP